ncbi:MAG: hypothetical protein ACM3X7_05220 [Solirubrobacterales bacterium]
MHTEHADSIFNDMRIIEKNIECNYTEIKNNIENYHKDLDFKFKYTINGYIITEINTDFQMCYYIQGNKLMLYYDGFKLQ